MRVMGHTAGTGPLVMGWSGAQIPPKKAAQGQRVVEKGADVADPHCGPLGFQRHMIEFRAEFLRRRPEFVSSPQNPQGVFSSLAGRPESTLQHIKTINSN